MSETMVYLPHVWQRRAHLLGDLGLLHADGFLDSDLTEGVDRHLDVLDHHRCEPTAPPQRNPET